MGVGSTSRINKDTEMHSIVRLLVLLLGLLGSVPATSFAQITIPNVFTPQTRILSSEVNANFAELGSKSLNRTGGTMTGTLTTQLIVPDGTGTRALGATGTRWSGIFGVNGDFSGTLNVTGAVTGGLSATFSSATAGANFFDVRSTNNGSATSAVVRVGNDAVANVGGFAATSTGFTPAGAFLADAAVLFSNRVGGLSIGAHDATGEIRFYSGGQTVRVTIDNAGRLILAGPQVLSGVISPPQITSDQNNYNPAGLASANVVRLSTDGIRTITGLAAQSAGTVLLLCNAGAFEIQFANESASSTAANRFATGGAGGVNVGGCRWIFYDGTSLRWRLAGGA